MVKLPNVRLLKSEEKLRKALSMYTTLEEEDFGVQGERKNIEL